MHQALHENAVDVGAPLMGAEVFVTKVVVEALAPHQSFTERMQHCV